MVDNATITASAVVYLEGFARQDVSVSRSQEVKERRGKQEDDKSEHEQPASHHEMTDLKDRGQYLLQ